jgi:MoxR-like ATPase
MALLGTPECLKGVSSLSAYRAYGQTTALVPGMVYEGEPTLLAGAAGCSKTTVAMQISAALTDPTASVPLPWGLGESESQDSGIVVYLDFEKRGKLSGEYK